MPLTKADIDAVNALRKAGRIEEARNLLRSIDDDKARAALIKFNERYPLAPAEPSKEKGTPREPGRRHNYPVWIMIGSIIGVLGVVMLISYISSKPGSDITITQSPYDFRAGYPDRLEPICQKRFNDGVTRKIYTSEDLALGCHYSVLNTLKVWPVEIPYCFGSFAQTDSRLDQCLKDQGVVILRTYIIQARDHPELLQTPGMDPTLDWDVLTQFPVTQSSGG